MDITESAVFMLINEYSTGAMIIGEEFPYDWEETYMLKFRDHRHYSSELRIEVLEEGESTPVEVLVDQDDVDATEYQAGELLSIMGVGLSSEEGKVPYLTILVETPNNNEYFEWE